MAWIYSTVGEQIVLSTEQSLATAREHVLRAEGQDRADLIEVFRADPIAWLRYCCWTYHVRDVDEKGVERPASLPDIPFDPWPIQEQAISTLVSAVEDGHDAVLR